MSTIRSHSGTPRAAIRLAHVIIILACTAAGACTTGRDAAPASGGQPSDTLKPAGADSTPSTSAGRTQPTPPTAAAVATPDTAAPHLIAGRTKHDSLAFASTVAFGRRQAAKWPAPPTPLAGSILPAK